MSRFSTGRIIVGMAVLLLAACGEGRRGGSAAHAPAAEVPGPPTPARADSTAEAPSIVFLGTSLTAGLGLDPDSAFPALLQRRLDSAGLHYSVVNAGQSGESSAGAVRRIDWILRQPPAVLVIETGANDGLRGQDPDSIQGNIEAMIERVRARAPETRVVLAGMEALPNLGQNYVRRFRAIYPAVARANGVALIPFLLAGVAGVDSLNQQDGIHPNEKGERIVADNVWKVLKPILQ